MTFSYRCFESRFTRVLVAIAILYAAECNGLQGNAADRRPQERDDINTPMTTPAPPFQDETKRPFMSAKFLVLSPRQGARYTRAPNLAVYAPTREDIIYALKQCTPTGSGSSCDMNRGTIEANELECVRDDIQCKAEVPFDMELPLGHLYTLHIRPKSIYGLTEVNFELVYPMPEPTQERDYLEKPATVPSVPAVRSTTGLIVESIEQVSPQIAPGQVVDLLVWIKNTASYPSVPEQRYSVVCEVKSGQGNCPFPNRTYPINVQILPGQRYSVKLTGAIAQPGAYAITVAAPMPEKGQPFLGNSVTKVIRVDDVRDMFRRYQIRPGITY